MNTERKWDSFMRNVLVLGQQKQCELKTLFPRLFQTQIPH